MKLLDDNQLKKEGTANTLGVKLNPAELLFKEGECVISEEPRIATDYKNLRWSYFLEINPQFYE